MKINITPSFISAFIACLLLSYPSMAKYEDKKRILVLHAYHQGFHWTDRIMDGIESVLSEKENIEVYVSYMDTKRRSDKKYFEIIKKLLKSKYEYTKFDAIISSDDHALDFLLMYRDELFPGVPVAFSGLNAFPQNRLKGQTGFSGIFESYDVKGTLDLMLANHPNAKKIVAITDETRSGNIFKSLINEAESHFSKQVQFEYLHNIPREELVKKLSALDENSLVLWAIYLRMNSGVTISSKESVALVSQASPVPTYCVWDVVGQGVVGGKITSPNYQGEAAARIALRVLDGERIDEIEIQGSPLSNIFDFTALDRFDISLSNLPQNSIILNKPDSFYERYKEYIWIYSGITFLLLITIIFLIAYILLKRNKDKLEGMAMHDQLTGLYNRYYLEEVSSQRLAEAARQKYSLCLMVLDLDLFKQINDKHGHAIGDKVLKKVANLLQKLCRSEDVVARIGGEEFVILLDYCGLEEAKYKAENIRQNIENLHPRGLEVTTSIGLAQMNANGEDFTSLFKRADAAVYEAKRQGRNRVESV